MHFMAFDLVQSKTLLLAQSGEKVHVFTIVPAFHSRLSLEDFYLVIGLWTPICHSLHTEHLRVFTCNIFTCVFCNFVFCNIL